MSDSAKRRVAMSATDFMAQLEGDQAYQRRRAEFQAGLQERAGVLRTAEQPIIADLIRVGVDVRSVWDLVNTWSIRRSHIRRPCPCSWSTLNAVGIRFG